MGTIDSSTTETELEAAFHNNCTYVEDNSTTKAAAFISVCAALLLRPSAMGKGTFSSSWNRQTLYDMMQDARRWLEARDTDYRAGPTVRDASFKRMRGNF